jgi:hypothetical protein
VRSRPALAALLAVAIAVVAGCGDDDGGAIDTSGTTTSSSSAPSSTAGGIDPMDDASTTPVSVPPQGATGAALLTDVRADRHEGYDRVVFEFSNVLPGYAVAYAEKPVLADGSGEEVAVAGEHVVVVRMEHASGADLTKEDAPQTYTGPMRFDPGTPEVAEVVRVGDFEGVLTWAIGTRDRVDFRVTTLDGPPRLVVDLRNH